MSDSSLKQKTAKGLLWGGFGTGIQQVLNLLFGVALARLLDKTDYGMVGVLAIFAGIANVLLSSGFGAALINKRDLKHRDCNAVFWFNILMGAFLYIVLFFCAPLIARFFNEPSLIPLSRYFFLAFFIGSSAGVHNAMLTRNLMVKQKAISQMPAMIISGSIGVFMAWNGMSYWGIATQNLTYILVLAICYWHFSPWRPTFQLDFRPLKELFGFSSKILITGTFEQICTNLLSTLIGRFYTKADVGSYTQSYKWNTMGYSFITGMISNVAQPVLAQVADDRERQQQVFRKMLRFTAFLSFPAMFGLALIAQEFIIITITDKWLQCVPMLQVLCLGGAFAPITTLYTSFIISKGKSNIYMWNTILLGLLQLGVMLTVYPYGISTMIRWFVIINIGWLGIWQFFVWRLIRLTLWNALKDILPFAGIAAVTTTATWYITSFIDNIYLMLTAKVLIAIVLYTLLMYLCDAAIFKESVNYLLKKNKKQRIS
mgnify:CR=1 FL=1